MVLDALGGFISKYRCAVCPPEVGAVVLMVTEVPDADVVLFCWIRAKEILKVLMTGFKRTQADNTIDNSADRC